MLSLRSICSIIVDNESTSRILHVACRGIASSCRSRIKFLPTSSNNPILQRYTAHSGAVYPLHAVKRNRILLVRIALPDLAIKEPSVAVRRGRVRGRTSRAIIAMRGTAVHQEVVTGWLISG